MQLLALLIMLGLLILLFLAASYFARGQTTHRRRYSSWSNLLDFRGEGLGRTMDMAEQLSHKIARGQGRHPHRKRSR
jgi:hypothetical protein